MVRTAVESSSSRMPNGRPPPIATAELTLPRMARTILAQLRTGHCRILGQYMSRIDTTAHNHSHDCGHSSHDTHHLFVCPPNPTALTVESLRSAPTEAAKHLNMSIDETSKQQLVKCVPLLSLFKSRCNIHHCMLKQDDPHNPNSTNNQR